MQHVYRVEVLAPTLAFSVSARRKLNDAEIRAAACRVLRDARDRSREEDGFRIPDLPDASVFVDVSAFTDPVWINVFGEIEEPDAGEGAVRPELTEAGCHPESRRVHCG